MHIFCQLGWSPSMALLKSKMHKDHIDPMFNYPDFMEKRTGGEDPGSAGEKQREFFLLSFLWNHNRRLHNSSLDQSMQSLVFTMELHPWRAQRQGSNAPAEREWSCFEDEGNLPILALSRYWFSGWPAITVQISKGHALWDSKLNGHSPVCAPPLSTR